jgi:hypothetical protein
MSRPEPNQPVHFRMGDNLKARVERFAIPRSIPVHCALRVLLNDALRRVENGEQIQDLTDPMRP